MSADELRPDPRRRPRWPRVLRWTAAAVLLLGLGLGLLAWFALATEPGARWLFTRVAGVLPGELGVEALEGPIRGPLTVRGLRYVNDAMEVTVERAFLDWRPGELLARRLDIHRLEADGVRVLTVPGPEEPERGPLPDVNLRFNVVVRHARVRDLELTSADGDPAEAFVLDAIDLATSARGGLVTVDRLTATSPDFDLAATGTLRPQGAYDVDLEADWSYRGEGSPPLAGRGTLTGTLEELTVRQELTEPSVIRLDALLRDPLYDLAFEAGIEADELSTRAFDPEWPEVTAAARLEAEGTLEELSLRGTVDADTADYGPFSARLDLALEGRRLDVRELEASLPGRATRATAHGELTLPESGSEEPLAVDLDLDWSDLAWPLEGEATLASTRGEATLAGTLDDYRLAATADLVRPAAEVADPEPSPQPGRRGDSPQDRSGGARPRPGGGTATGGAAASGPSSPLGTWSVEGRGDGEGFEVAKLTGEALGGRLTGSGRVGWSPRVEWSLDLEGDGFDPSVLAAGYPGSLAFRATTAGHVEEAGPVGRVELASLEGTLREQPVAARGTVELAGGVVRLDPFEVTWAEDRLEASGSLGERYDLILHLEAPNLAVALADVAGTVEADATVTGPSGAPRIELTARGESLAWGERRMAGLDLAADIDLAADGPMDVELAADGLDLGTIRADRLAVDGEGTRGEHTLTADLYPREDGPAAVRLALAGGLDPGEELVWRGRITRLDADADAAGGLRTAPGGSAPSTAGGRSPSAAGGAGGSSAGGLQELGTWRLDGPADLVASARTVTLGGFCWVGRGSVCGEGSWQAEGGWSADATLAGVPLALGRSFLPPDVEIGGDLEGTLAARADAAGRLTGNLELLPGPGVLVFPAASGRERRQRFEQGTVTAAAGAEGVTADLGLVLVDVGRIDGHLELPDELATGSPSASRRVRGRLTATLSDVSFVQALVDGVTGVGGRLDADLTLSGTRGAPEVRGEAVLADARADVPAIGLELRDLRLAARGVGREPVALDGSVRSGEGALTLTGSVPLAPSAETPARLTARGRDFEVVDTEEVHALASPDLTLVHDGALAEVTGEVRVPEARVEIAKRSEEGAVSVSDDVVFVGPDAAGEPRPGSAEVAGRVRVILGDDVEVDVLGLHAEPTGSLLIVEAPDRPTTATGELEVSEGTFQAYGQDLTIERGRLVFAGPVTDPGIDLRAFRRASDGVVAGLDATGTLRAPEVTLWSEPPMAQSEQLSYLLLGRPLDQASASDGDVLANAATSLGIKGGNLLGKRLAARYGLEEARIEGGSRDEASLVLGKYLSPRLLVGYGIGLFEAVNTFRIRYLLTDALALEAMTGEGTSADLLYTLERGEGAERDPPPGRPR